MSTYSSFDTNTYTTYTNRIKYDTNATDATCIVKILPLLVLQDNDKEIHCDMWKFKG